MKSNQTFNQVGNTCREGFFKVTQKHIWPGDSQADVFTLEDETEEENPKSKAKSKKDDMSSSKKMSATKKSEHKWMNFDK